jgi:hypothetical protein
LQSGDERHERHSREEPDENRNHHAVAVAGEEGPELDGGCAGRGQHTLDQVGENEQDRSRQAAQAQQPDGDCAYTGWARSGRMKSMTLTIAIQMSVSSAA